MKLEAKLAAYKVLLDDFLPEVSSKDETSEPPKKKNSSNSSKDNVIALGSGDRFMHPKS